MAIRAVAAVLGAALLAPAAGPAAGEVSVKDTAGLREALRNLRPGATVVLAPGEYEGGHYLTGLAGTEKAPITIRGADPAKPPTLRGGGSEGLHLTDVTHVRLQDLRVVGFPGNGINIDDGGTPDTPTRHVVLERVVVEDTGPKGNHDALKMSGVAGFLVRECRFRGWGGSAIDLVGCRDGVIDQCRFEGKDGVLAPSGVQLKGGTRDVSVRRCWFDDCTERAVNLGGSTGLAYFRPPDADFEAKDIEVAGCRFHGGTVPVAFVGSVGGKVHRNTIHRPRKWVLRILQETTEKRFQPCRDGVFERNLVVLGDEVKVAVNVGPGTAPETFALKGNAWFQPGSDRPPSLPVAEEDGVHGVDPKLEDPGGPAMRPSTRDRRLSAVGAHAYEPPPGK
jgi:hypothetical protein